MSLRHAEYTVPKSLPACNVDVQLLREIEALLLIEVPQILALPPSSLNGALSITFEEAAGKYSLASMNQHQGTLLPDEITQVELQLSDANVGVAIRIVFSNGKHGGRLEVTCKGPNCRAQANEIAISLTKLVQTRKNLRAFSLRTEPTFEILRLFTGFGAFVTFMIAVAAGGETPVDWPQAARLMLVTVFLVCIAALPILVPAYRFDHASTKNRDTVVGWILGTVSASIVAVVVQWVMSA